MPVEAVGLAASGHRGEGRERRKRGGGQGTDAPASGGGANLGGA